MPTVAIVEHRVPGRVRVRIPSKRHDLSFFEEVLNKIRPHPNVHHVRANTYTGSVVIHHSGNANDIFALAVDLFELSSEDKAVKALEKAAERSGLPLPDFLDVGLVIVQLLHGQVLGSATSLLYYSLLAHQIAEGERKKTPSTSDRTIAE